MNFNPTHTLDVFSEEDFAVKMPMAEETIAQCMTNGFFETFDGKKFYYEYFTQPSSKGAIIIVHGLSEFTKKFNETVYYFLNFGYDVFVYDQRSHGLSCRMAEDITLLHVDRFKDYADDLNAFITGVVQKVTQKPLYIFSHSMGGAVTALYLKSYKHKIKKAVLSSPLIEPELNGVPPWLARNGTGVCGFFQGYKARYRYAKEFDPNPEFKEKEHNSRKRFDYNMDWRRKEPMYQTTPLSNGWVYETLKMRPKMMKRSFLKALTIPMLLITATDDTVVKTSYHIPFAKGCPDCRVKIVEAGHNLFSGESQVIEECLKAIFEFFEN